MQVSDHGVLVVELGSGLSFPAIEHLSHVIHTQALQGKCYVSSGCKDPNTDKRARNVQQKANFIEHKAVKSKHYQNKQNGKNKPEEQERTDQEHR